MLKFSKAVCIPLDLWLVGANLGSYSSFSESQNLKNSYSILKSNSLNYYHIHTAWKQLETSPRTKQLGYSPPIGNKCKQKALETPFNNHIACNSIEKNDKRKPVFLVLPVVAFHL